MRFNSCEGRVAHPSVICKIVSAPHFNTTPVRPLWVRIVNFDPITASAHFVRVDLAGGPPLVLNWGAPSLTIFKGGAFGPVFSCPSDLTQSSALSLGNGCNSKSPPFKNGRVRHPNFKTFGCVRAIRPASMQDKIRIFRVLRYVLPHCWTNNVYLEVFLTSPVESSFC
jgi:hypothetical protein